VASAAPFNAAAVATTPVTLANLSLTLNKRWTGLSSPLYLTNAKDGSGRLFVVEQTGRVRVIDGGTLQSTPYIDLHTLVSTGGERGLLGLAFSPNFATDRRIYVDYTNTNGDTVIARYTASSAASSAPVWSKQTRLLLIKQPYANHNGGCLQFGPDGYLYIGMGDGGSHGDPGNRAQNKSVLLGKILRIDPSKSSGTKNYSIPPTNPWKLTKTASLRPAPEVWALGVRNPWRFSFDASTTALWVADVGQDAWEEIDYVTQAAATSRATKGGLNFGWHKYEGGHYYPSGKTVPSAKRSSAYVWPIFNYAHPYGESITGGYVYRGSEYPALVGTYVYADYVNGWIGGIRRTAPDGTKYSTPEKRKLLTTSGNPASFGVDEANELYLVDLKGSVYQVQGVPK
jgi:glucose/arabinose dehydrogenase